MQRSRGELKDASSRVADGQKIRTCPVLEEMGRGEFSNLAASGCLPECLTYHKIAYLEHCIEKAIVPALLDELLKDDSSYVRRLCQIVAEQHGIPARQLARDPAHEIRAAHLCRTTELDDLVDSIDDEDRTVRKYLLKRLQPESAIADKNLHDANPAAFHAEIGGCTPVPVPNQRQEQVFMQLSNYINDKDHTVRLEFIRALRAFPGLADEFILKLFDKKNIGLFVYGAEDETMELRRELILSIETFVRGATADVIFEYLIDMLNDEAEAVRKIVVSVLCRVATSHQLTVSTSQLDFILSGLEENNMKIKGGILRVLSNLSYDSIDIYHDLAEQKNVEVPRVLKTIRRIVRRNRALFKRNVASIYSYSVFDENPCRDGTAKRLYEPKYLAKLVVLHTLLKYYKIDVAEPVRRDFGFLRLKLFGRKDEVPLGHIEAVREAAVQFFEGSRVWDEKLFPAADMKIPASRYFVELCQAGSSWLMLGDKEPLYRLAYTFGVRDHGSLPAPQEAMLQICAGDSRPSRSDLLEYLSGLNAAYTYSHIVMCEFIVSAPDEAVTYEHTGALACFDVSLSYAYSIPSIKFVVANSSTGRVLEYSLADKIRIVINECPETLFCYIAVWQGGHAIKLSDTRCVKIILRRDAS